jgi:hypothetical protein
MRRHSKMNDSAGTNFNDEEDIERAKPEVVGLEKIASPNPRRVILQKAALRLARFSSR